MTIVEKLTPNPVLPEGSKEKLPERPALTADEQSLLDRCRTFVVNALKRHGIGLNPSEANWVGAEVADFVMKEYSGAGTQVSVQSESPQGAPDAVQGQEP
jgi:hypothetical protein